jgi:hypothetical protein
MLSLNDKLIHFLKLLIPTHPYNLRQKRTGRKGGCSKTAAVIFKNFQGNAKVKYLAHKFITVSNGKGCCDLNG